MPETGGIGGYLTPIATVCAEMARSGQRFESVRGLYLNSLDMDLFTFGVLNPQAAQRFATARAAAATSHTIEEAVAGVN